MEIKKILTVAGKKDESKVYKVTQCISPSQKKHINLLMTSFNKKNDKW